MVRVMDVSDLDHDSYEELCRFIHIVSGAAAEQNELANVNASDNELELDTLISALDPRVTFTALFIQSP